MSKEILFLQPVFKQMIWGGNRMRTEFGYDIPGDDTGECWAISAHKNGDCTVAEGSFEGKTLSWLWENERELFGNASGDRFPLLTKIIDARQNLSVQVHPDDKYAMEHENGSLGKTECWYILDCDENAGIIIGHNAKTKQELEDMIHGNRWDELIREIPIKKGDFLQIYPGTVHAIKGGTMILETQQNSDITYRVYDYGRLSDGKPRQLHIQQSIDVITVPHTEAAAAEKGKKFTEISSEGNVGNNNLITCDYYSVWKLDVNGRAAFLQDKKYLLCSVIEGEGSIDGHAVKKGTHFILPYGYGEFSVQGDISLIVSCTN